MDKMIACFDVQYGDQTGCAAAVVFDDWFSAVARAQYTKMLPIAAAYQPGQFFRRELGPLNSVFAVIEEPIDVCVIDAYCTLDDSGNAGLGSHFYQAVQAQGRNIPVIGVAKNRFRDTTHAAEVLRGSSQRPLFVTSVGMPLQQAADRIAKIHGDHREPTMLKLVDRIARDG